MDEWKNRRILVCIVFSYITWAWELPCWQQLSLTQLYHIKWKSIFLIWILVFGIFNSCNVHNVWLICSERLVLVLLSVVWYFQDDNWVHKCLTTQSDFELLHHQTIYLYCTCPYIGCSHI
jgi:hypothetical protein